MLKTFLGQWILEDEFATFLEFIPAAFGTCIPRGSCALIQERVNNGVTSLALYESPLDDR
jgi:hypothetical protein